MSNPTWRALTTAAAYTAYKDMINVFNGVSSVKVLKIARVFFFNNGTVALSDGVLTTMQVRRITSVVGGTSITCITHDTSNSALDLNTTAGTNQLTVGTDIFRRVIWSIMNPVVSGFSMNEWELLVPMSQLFEAGYGDNNVRPITCRAGQGAEIYHSGTATLSTADTEIEFTNN